jgi:hypothetical protein
MTHGKLQLPCTEWTWPCARSWLSPASRAVEEEASVSIAAASSAAPGHETRLVLGDGIDVLEERVSHRRGHRHARPEAIVQPEPGVVDKGEREGKQDSFREQVRL